MRRQAFLVIRVFVTLGLTGLIALTVSGVVANALPAQRFAISCGALVLALLLATAIWAAMRDVDGRL